MRYLTTLVFSFFTSLLFSQPDPAAATAYVWAKSGLTLRDAATPEGDKLSVIPFGAKVEILPAGSSAVYDVPTLPEFAHGNAKSLPWKMTGTYTKVRYGDQTGFVFDPYLLPYQTPDYALNPDGTCCENAEDMGAWMNRVFGKPDTLCSNYNAYEAKGSYILKYPNGVLDYGTLMQGGSGTEMVWPGLNLARGFVLLDHFWDITGSIAEKTTTPDEAPCLLKQQPDLLDFWLGPTSDGATIRQVGIFLYISSYASC